MKYVKSERMHLENVYSAEVQVTGFDLYVIWTDLRFNQSTAAFLTE
jgi:hypothetical protein